MDTLSPATRAFVEPSIRHVLLAAVNCTRVVAMVSMTCTVTVAVFDTRPWASDTRYVNDAVPANPAAGVKVTTPVAAFTAAAPFAGAVTTVTEAGLMLVPVSLASTLIATAAATFVDAESLTATGAVGAATTVTVTVAGLETPPKTSATVYLKLVL